MNKAIKAKDHVFNAQGQQKAKLTTQRTKELQGADKFGTCIECGKNSYDSQELVRITLGSIYKMSTCLCPECLNRLIGELRDNF